MASRARVNDNVYYHLLEMAVGAEVNGKLVHLDDSSPGKVAAEPVGREQKPI